MIECRRCRLGWTLIDRTSQEIAARSDRGETSHLWLIGIPPRLSRISSSRSLRVFDLCLMPRTFCRIDLLFHHFLYSLEAKNDPIIRVIFILSFCSFAEIRNTNIGADACRALPIINKQVVFFLLHCYFSFTSRLVYISLLDQFIWFYFSTPEALASAFPILCDSWRASILSGHIVVALYVKHRCTYSCIGTGVKSSGAE